MSRDWQLSLTGAVVFHLALLFGFQLSLSRPARLVRQQDVLEVALVAAPAPVATPPVIHLESQAFPPPPPVAPPETKPPLPQPAQSKVLLVTATMKPGVMSPTPAPKAMVVGDGSFIKPARTVTPQTAQPESRAAPDYLNNPEPPYPLTARRRHQEGLVLVTVFVSAQGRAVRVQIKSSSGFPILDDAALRAVQNWEFKPARIGANAIESQIEVPVRFELTE